MCNAIQSASDLGVGKGCRPLPLDRSLSSRDAPELQVGQDLSILIVLCCTGDRTQRQRVDNEAKP